MVLFFKKDKRLCHRKTKEKKVTSPWKEPPVISLEKPLRFFSDVCGKPLKLQTKMDNHKCEGKTDSKKTVFVAGKPISMWIFLVFPRK